MAVEAIAVLAGIISHIAYFHHGEHHMLAPTYVRIFFALCATAVAVNLYVNNQTLGSSLACTSSLAICYLVGVYTALLAYRYFFSPLNKFPGPYGARASTLWFSAQLAKHDAFKKVLGLHNKYGAFLRIGPNDLSIVHPSAVNAIYGHGSKCTKSEFYDMSRPLISLRTARDRTVHDRRRRIWSSAFSDKALRGYEERIKVFQDQLVTQISALDGQAVNVAKWFSLYNFDIMGDLAFGKSFDMLLSREEHWAIKILSAGMVPFGYYWPCWLFRVLASVPTLMDDWWKFVNYCCRQLDERMEVISAGPIHLQLLTLDRQKWQFQTSCPHC